MGMIVAKRRKEPEMKADMADHLIEEEHEFSNAKRGSCDCGNRVTSLAKNLQKTGSDKKMKCFNCLLHEGKVEVVHR